MEKNNLTECASEKYKGSCAWNPKPERGSFVVYFIGVVVHPDVSLGPGIGLAICASF
jgi:hypothetical protein